ncbi:hypothetical protein GCM10008955_10460 [Deinococcus malanensis]|uniref:Uncharacterized protein n=1 Tax=Deinococcus malanensis TaxID=1706855 RepID=A0ABQ2EPN6_9DEIO|nr:hypothetical protein GCM10008955_10460 [Deinococcus malanensis]
MASQGVHCTVPCQQRLGGKQVLSVPGGCRHALIVCGGDVSRRKTRKLAKGKKRGHRTMSVFRMSPDHLDDLRRRLPVNRRQAPPQPHAHFFLIVRSGTQPIQPHIGAVNEVLYILLK